MSCRPEGGRLVVGKIILQHNIEVDNNPLLLPNLANFSWNQIVVGYENVLKHAHEIHHSMIFCELLSLLTETKRGGGGSHVATVLPQNFFNTEKSIFLVVFFKI